MSFEHQFTHGIAYRAHFDPSFKLDDEASRVLENTFAQTSSKAMEEPFFSIRQSVCSQAAIYAADQASAHFAYQCLADSHTFLQACLEHNIVNPRYMTLTVGDVSLDGQRLFNASRTTIGTAVEKGISTADEPTFHVWLTLADMTVIDLTLVRQLAASGKLPEPADADAWLTVWRQERKGRFDYHPILIDDDFLSRLQRPSH